MNPICPYCSREAERVTGDVVYPNRPDLKELVFWRCAPCDARVGCYKGTDRPFGSLANAELREARNVTHHRFFDPLWQEGSFGKGQDKRTKAYAWLAEKLGITADRCHIGMFDLETCRRVQALCLERSMTER